MREPDESWDDLQRNLQTAIAEVNVREGVTKLRLQGAHLVCPRCLQRASRERESPSSNRRHNR